MDPPGLSIQEVAARTGIGQATLRAWEARYGFPIPSRRPSGHRRYSEADVETLQQVMRDRVAGVSLPAAIERGRLMRSEPSPSIYATLRRRRPDLSSSALPKRTLVALSRAIEDECCAQAEHPLLFATFQREVHYRNVEQRWRDMARTADLTVVFADFAERGDPPGGPVELPITIGEPLSREWAVICDGPEYRVCLSAWERPGQDGASSDRRIFETIWSMDCEAVRQAARLAAGLAAQRAPELIEPFRGRLREESAPAEGDLRQLSLLSNRIVAYLGEGEFNRRPARGPSPAA